MVFFSRRFTRPPARSRCEAPRRRGPGAAAARAGAGPGPLESLPEARGAGFRPVGKRVGLAGLACTLGAGWARGSASIRALPLFARLEVLLRPELLHAIQGLPPPPPQPRKCSAATMCSAQAVPTSAAPAPATPRLPCPPPCPKPPRPGAPAPPSPPRPPPSRLPAQELLDVLGRSPLHLVGPLSCTFQQGLHFTGSADDLGRRYFIWRGCKALGRAWDAKVPVTSAPARGVVEIGAVPRKGGRRARQPRGRLGLLQPAQEARRLRGGFSPSFLRAWPGSTATSDSLSRSKALGRRKSRRGKGTPS